MAVKQCSWYQKNLKEKIVIRSLDAYSVWHIHSISKLVRKLVFCLFVCFAIRSNIAVLLWWFLLFSPFLFLWTFLFLNVKNWILNGVLGICTIESARSCEKQCALSVVKQSSRGKRCNSRWWQSCSWRGLRRGRETFTRRNKDVLFGRHVLGLPACSSTICHHSMALLMGWAWWPCLYNNSIPWMQPSEPGIDCWLPREYYLQCDFAVREQQEAELSNWDNLKRVYKWIHYKEYGQCIRKLQGRIQDSGANSRRK